jgi:hypothetical protein
MDGKGAAPLFLAFFMHNRLKTNRQFQERFRTGGHAMSQPRHTSPNPHESSAPEGAGTHARHMPPVADGETVEHTGSPAPESLTASLKTRLKPLLDATRRAFTEHPAAAGETYWQHLLFTLGMGARLMFAGFVILLHGILPFTLTYTGSNHLKKCNKILSERAKTARMPCESPLPYGDHI